MGTNIFTRTEATDLFETMRPVVESLHARADGRFDYYSLAADDAALREGRTPKNAVLAADECKQRWPTQAGLIDRIVLNVTRE